MATRTHGPGITYFVREYQMLAVLAGGGHSTLMLGRAIGLGHTTHAFKSAHGYLNRHGWIDYQRSAWRIMPKGQAYLDEHPMEVEPPARRTSDARLPACGSFHG